MRVSITGPESSGKSVLSKQLAEHFNAGWVPEYARNYLENQGGDTTLSDLVTICRGQLESERELQSKHADIICDTDFLVYGVIKKKSLPSPDESDLFTRLVQNIFTTTNNLLLRLRTKWKRDIPHSIRSILLRLERTNNDLPLCLSLFTLYLSS